MLLDEESTLYGHIVLDYLWRQPCLPPVYPARQEHQSGMLINQSQTLPAPSQHRFNIIHDAEWRLGLCLDLVNSDPIGELNQT
jgi:hypothetical protein